MRKASIFLILFALLFSVCSCISGNADTDSDVLTPRHDSEDNLTGNRILIAYFSRYGNTDYPEDVDATSSASIVLDEQRYGTTEYIARIIQEYTGGTLHLIETEVPYTSDFNELRDVNHSEMQQGVLPELKESNLNISDFDTVFIGYPVWAIDAPRAVVSFLNEYDLSDKTVIPFCTHDGYGAGRSYTTIERASNSSNVLNGIAIESKDVLSSKEEVFSWLSSIGLSEKKSETAIEISIGDITLDGVLYDTALAAEISRYFPLTISMRDFGSREYYGGVDFYPENLEGGQKTFMDGEITYCEAHHNMAVFYVQTADPILSVDVIPIGKVTSDLSIFNDLPNCVQITFDFKK